MTAPPEAPTTPDIDSPAESTEKKTKYPYFSILNELDSKAYQCLSRSSEPDVKDSAVSSWDLSKDALLATLLHEFTNHMVQRTHEVSTQVKTLQSSVNKVGVDLASVQNEWMKCGRTVVMEQVVMESDSSRSDGSASAESKDQENNESGVKQLGSDDDDSAAEIARLEEEEKSAIRDGMKALSLFYDGKQARQSSDGTGDEIGLGNDDYMHSFDGVVNDNCYYYPSADGDVFNQRPLPFIVCSREFMESSSAGLDAAEDFEKIAE